MTLLDIIVEFGDKQDSVVLINRSQRINIE